MSLPNKISSLAILVAASTVSAGALAGPSSPAEYRGYSKCLNAAAEESNGLSAERRYLLDRQDERISYYINANRWQDGDRVAVRISCQTSTNGRTLFGHSIEPGSFLQRRGNVSIEVANR